MTIKIYNQDCMEAMAKMEDNAFDLAIVDPPYGIGESKKKRENTPSDKWKSPYKKQHKPKKWDENSVSSKELKEVIRVSFNQIIWGANFRPEVLKPSMGWVIWDKKNGNSDFSDCEIAYSSFNKGVRKFSWLWNGFQKEKPEDRIHPTQKPVALYKWLLKNYAKEGDKILDTYLGSGSIAIACHDLGFDLEAYEIDKEYYDAAMDRLKTHQSQLQLF